MRTFILLVAFAAVAAARPRLAGGMFGTTLEVQFDSINTSTGEMDPVDSDSPLPYESQCQGLSSIDDRGGIYYGLFYNQSQGKPNLVGIDISSGKVKYNCDLPFIENAFVGVGQQIDVDPSNGHVFAGGRLSANGPHTVGRVDPTTCAYTKIASINATDLPVLGGPSAFDPRTRQLLLQLGLAATNQIAFFAVNVDDGTVERIIDGPSSGGLSTLAYDKAMTRMVGLGIQVGPGGLLRTLVSFDPPTKQFHTMCNVTDYTIESGGESAFDPSTNTLYWIGQKTGANATAPFELVGSSAHDCSTNSAPMLCPDDAHCPWTIEFYSPDP